jgi:hypothetical protein
MTSDELLTHLEAELARCQDERDRLSAELEAAVIERDRALQERARWDRLLLTVQVELDEAEYARDYLYGELQSVLGSKSWVMTRPLRQLFGSTRPENPEVPEGGEL